MFWWVIYSNGSERWLLGPFDNDTDARQKGDEKKLPYTLHELPTKDESRATRMIRAKSVELDRGMFRHNG